ncbi:MAG: hypothetical protein ACPLYF_01430, partial [Fervidobacterium sp.]
MKIATFDSRGFQKVGVFVENTLIDVDLLFETLAHLTGKEFLEILTITDAIENWEEVLQGLSKGKKIFGEKFTNLFGVKKPEL